jgi:hypothetical protein
MEQASLLSPSSLIRLRLLKEQDWDFLCSRIQQVLQSRGYTMSDLDRNIAAERILATEYDVTVNRYLTDDTALIRRLRRELNLSAFVDYTPLFGKKDNTDIREEESVDDTEDLFPAAVTYTVTPSLLADKTVNITPMGLLGYICTIKGVEGGFYVNCNFLAPYVKGSSIHEPIQCVQFVKDRLLLDKYLVFTSNCAITAVYRTATEVLEATEILSKEASIQRQEIPDFSWEWADGRPVCRVKDYFGSIVCRVRRAEDISYAFRAGERLSHAIYTDLEGITDSFNQLMGTPFTSQELVTLAATIGTGTRNKELCIALNSLHIHQ